MRLEVASKPVHIESEVPVGILVQRATNGDKDASEQLFQILRRAVTRILNIRLRGAGDAEEGAQHVCMTTLEQIQNGSLRNPDAVVAYARTIAIRYATAAIDDVVQARQRADIEEAERSVPCGSLRPDGIFERGERVALMKEVLGELSAKDREVLTRFYIEEQPAQQVCGEMGLTETQFRLLKSRAKDRFGELGRKLMAKQLPRVRTSNGTSHGVTRARAATASV